MSTLSREQNPGLFHVLPRGEYLPKPGARFEEPQSPRASFVPPPANIDYFRQDDRRGSDSRSSRSRTRDSPPSRSPSRSVSLRSGESLRSWTGPRNDTRDRSLSRTPSPRRPPSLNEKAWYKKKTLWATVGTITAVTALIPAWVSAKADTVSAKASQDAARASERAARAWKRSADAVEASAMAVINTSVATGRQDCYGRYTGPRSVRSRSSGGRSGGRPILEYDVGWRESRRW